MFQYEANGNYGVLECATVLGGVHKVGLHIVSRDRKYAELVDHLIMNALFNVVFT